MRAKTRRVVRFIGRPFTKLLGGLMLLTWVFCEWLDEK
jgi:hypothetical protein